MFSSGFLTSDMFKFLIHSELNFMFQESYLIFAHGYLIVHTALLKKITLFLIDPGSPLSFGL